MRALISVHDKTGVETFARDLVNLGWEIVSTGGTLAAIRAAGIPATSVSDITGFPEILDGRVKTLHPRIHGGLLARLELDAHRAALASHGIEPIGLVACNLYPFERTVATDDVPFEDAIEQIDIGGPAMIRAAAKNHSNVIVVVEPAQYESVIETLRAGDVPSKQRRAFAARAFAHVSAYDAVIAEYLRGDDEPFPGDLTFAGRRMQQLRYGENPGQSAAAYRALAPGSQPASLLDAVQLQGKELSFNNLLDAEAARNTLRRIERPAVAIVKHTIPCGVAVREALDVAFDEALKGDPVSAFGGIVALNRVVDASTARRLAEIFFEVIIAPGYSDDARSVLSRKKSLRLLEVALPQPTHRTRSVRAIDGGYLVQQADQAVDDASSWTVVTSRQPSDGELRDLQFAWEVARHVKSNAIVFVREEAVTGVGSGQPNRLESVRIAASKAGERASGSVLASDAFFPFADGLLAGVSAGVTAVVQPGGSVRDDEVIAAANDAGIAMVFTGVRHFLH